jgi:Pretoxin HINT domain
MPAGLQDNNARDYSPATGRFISADPAGLTGSGNNLYQYAGGDPVDHSDPSGLQWQLLAGCAVGGLVNDLGGWLDGRKHSLGDYFAGAGRGCLSGLLMTIPGAGEGIDALEGGQTALTGADTGQDLSTVGDDLSGDGAPPQDGPGPGACGADPNSFAASTPVTLASGKTEPISKIKPGDKVLATDTATGKTSPEPVLAVIRGHKTEQLVALTIRAKVHGHWRSGTITATAGHLIYDLTRHTWVTASQLRPGERLDTLTRGAAAVVTSIHIHPPREVTVYNLTIGTDHDYYVIANDVSLLVHNAGGPINLGAGYTGRVDVFNFGRGVDFEIHVFFHGEEIGLFGSEGFFAKHGLGSDVEVPESVYNRLKGVAIDLMRGAGRIGPKGTQDITGDNWTQPRGC